MCRLLLLGPMALQRTLQLRRFKIGHDEHFLDAASFASYKLVAAADCCGHSQLKGLTSAPDAIDDGWGDGLDAFFTSKRFQPRDQALDIGAVGDDDPSQT